MNHLLIFARYPELGQVKTRLAQGVGPEEALRVYQQLLRITHSAAAGLAARKTLWLAGEASVEGSVFTSWTEFEQRQQHSGDLGQRMYQAFAAAFQAGATAVVIIGTDCPDLTEQHLQEAFRQLTEHDVVIGPAQDGGYYLLGLRTLVPDFFTDKLWSTDTVLAATLADAQRLGLRTALLPVLSDIDTAADLAAWQARILAPTQ